MNETKDYAVVIYWDDTINGYVGTIPDLWPCSASGDTPEEALREVLTAKRLVLEVMREHGMPIPEPTYKPEKAHTA